MLCLPEHRQRENQQRLQGDALIRIRSDRDSDFLGVNLAISQINQVARIEKLRDDQKEVASLLSSLLVDTMRRLHPHGSVEAAPAERILARCLAIAPIESLEQTITTLLNEVRTVGKKFAWFVTVFLNRIHGVDPELVVKTFEQVLQEKNSGNKPDDLFANDLVTQAASKLRRLA